MSVEESEKKTESEIKMKLGDIIKIESTNPDYNSYFFVEYIDDVIIKIINVENGKKDTIDLDQDGCLTETTIQRIFLHSRSDDDGFARQNGLLQDTYVKLIFDDNIEITGKITNLEEDMIEILLTGEENEKIYIDFEYKGIPKNIPLKTITIIEQPSISEVIEKKIIKETSQETSQETASIEHGSEGEIYIDIPENPKLDINPPIVFGKEIEFVVDTGLWEQRYGIEMQTTDLLNELLSTIPDSSRTSTVMERVYRIIRRFKELREQFSVFDENGNVVSSKKVSALYKPLVERMNNLDINLKWIIPVVKQKTKLYIKSMNNDEMIEYSDINEEQEEYKNSLEVYKTTNNYPAFYNAVNDMFTPFTQPLDKKYTVNADLETIVDNLENYYTHVYKDSINTKKKRFFFQRYNLGMTKIGNKEMRSGKSIYMRENMTKNDALSIKSVFMLPKPAIQFSRINLPGTDILSRCGLSHNWMHYFAFLNNRTNFKSIQLQNIDDEYDYKKENDFLDTAMSFNIPDNPSYETLLKAIIPMSASIIRLLKSENIGYNFHDIISFYEPFMLYLDTITYSGLSKIKEGGPYQEMRFQILENIKKYDENFKKKSRKYQSISKSFEHIMQKTISMFVAINLAMENQIKKDYKLNEITTSSEVLNKMLELDNSNFYMSMLSLSNTNLYIPDLAELLEKSEYGKDTFLKPNLCFTRVIAKKYISIKSLVADNDNEDIYFDKEYDTTPYNILKKYKEAQAKQSPSDFLDYFTTVLSKEHQINDEQLAKTIIHGKKKVEENNYAILVIYPKPISELSDEEEESVKIEADVKKKVRYFKRIGTRWIEDEDMVDSELTNELLCNTDKNCSYNKEICNAKETVENFTEKIKKIQLLREKQIKRIRALKELKTEEFSLRAFSIGKNIVLPEIKTSPHAALRDKILGLKDLSTKQEFIQKFVKNFCRKPLANESVDWLYCKETNTKLLPSFFDVLANIFFLDVDLYEERLDIIIATQGTKSDDGDAIIDKHSGYVIKYLDYVAQDEFDENGFVIKTHSIIEKNMSEILEDAIHAEIENNQTMPVVSEKKHFDNPIHEDIYKVSKAILKNLGIEFEKISDTIISHTSRIITKYLASEERYNASIAGKEKKLKYKDYKNQQIFFFTVGITLIVYQTHIPSFQPKKTFPGCVYSLSGYPLDEVSGNKSGINYLCCVLEKMKNATTQPWKSVSKFTSEKFQEKISKDFLDKILKDAEIQHLLTLKRHYILTSPEVHHIPLEHRVEKWSLFQPPLIKSAVEKTVSGVSKTIGDEIRDTMKSGNADQHKYIGTLYKKIIEHTYLTIDDINAIVHDIGKDALLKAGTIVFLENSCCESSVNRKVIDYFTEKTENIQKCIDFVEKYEKIYDEIKSLTIPAFAAFKLVMSEPPPPLATVYNENNIYSAIIHYCKLKTNLPIPDDLETICQEKIVGLETMNMNQTIDKLKEKYKNPTEIIMELMKIISLRNRVEISFSDEDVPTFDDIFIRDNIDNLIKTALINDNTDALTVFLHDSIKTMQEEIQKYIREYNKGLKKTDSTNLFKFIENIHVWSDYKHMYPFIKNAVYNVIKVIPSIINNESLKNMDMENRNHWGFSGKHKDVLTGFVEKYFENVHKFKDNQNLSSFFKEIHDGEDFSDIELLVSQLPTIKFAEPVMHKIYNYCYLSVYYKIIQKSLTYELKITLEEEQSTDFGIEVRAQDNRQYFCQEVSKLMADILKMDMENKKVINFNYAELLDKYKKDVNAEKIQVTTELGNMGNFELGVENLMKEYKIGKWKENTGVFKYDPRYYDNEVSGGAKVDQGQVGQVEVEVDGDADEPNDLEEGDAENHFDNEM
jgi:hypothetical protein